MIQHTDEREDWDELVNSRGWKRLLAIADETWLSGEAFRRRATAASKSHQVEKDFAALVAATEVLSHFLGVPASRLQQMKQAHEEGQRQESDAYRGLRRVP